MRSQLLLIVGLVFATLCAAYNRRPHVRDHFHDIEDDVEFEEYIIESNYAWGVLFYSDSYEAAREEEELDGAIGIWDSPHGEHGTHGLTLQVARANIAHCPKTAKHYKAAAGELFLWHYHGRKAVKITFDDGMNTPWHLMAQHELHENLAKNPIAHGHYRKIDEPKEEL